MLPLLHKDKALLRQHLLTLVREQTLTMPDTVPMSDAEDETV